MSRKVSPEFRRDLRYCSGSGVSGRDRLTGNIWHPPVLFLARQCAITAMPRYGVLGVDRWAAFWSNGALASRWPGPVRFPSKSLECRIDAGAVAISRPARLRPEQPFIAPRMALAVLDSQCQDASHPEARYAWRRGSSWTQVGSITGHVRSPWAGRAAPHCGRSWALGPLFWPGASLPAQRLSSLVRAPVSGALAAIARRACQGWPAVAIAATLRAIAG
jgi:hypothetical protein